MIPPPKGARRRPLRFSVPLLAIAFAACSDAAEPVAISSAPNPASALLVQGTGADHVTVDARMDLATLRRTVAPFHDVDNAMEAGWNVAITPCLSSPDGAMGYHYANPSLLEDAVVTPDAPETLLYEPMKNGKLRFVGVEFIVPLELSENPPSLFGQHFHRNEEVGIWALHAWVGRDNPDGLFADWNPRVSCEHAD